METGTRGKPGARLGHGRLTPWAALGAEVAALGWGIEIAPPVSHWLRAAGRRCECPGTSRLPETASSAEVQGGLHRPGQAPEAWSWHRPPGRGAGPEGVPLKFIKSRRVNGDKTITGLSKLFL